jgi:hypothetical protein
VPGRRIGDNIMALQLLPHLLRRAGRWALAAFCDFRKASDTIDVGDMCLPNQPLAFLPPRRPVVCCPPLPGGHAAVRERQRLCAFSQCPQRAWRLSAWVSQRRLWGFPTRLAACRVAGRQPARPRAPSLRHCGAAAKTGGPPPRPPRLPSR